MKPEEIKAELTRLRIPLKAIAESVPCDKSQVTRCINGAGLYQRTREIIAAKIGKPVSRVFGRQHPQPKRSAKRSATAAA